MSGGDGMGGLAVAIGVAMIVMVTVPVVVLVLIAKRFGAAAVVGAVVVGLLIGVLAVSATFFESSWSPPLRIELEGPSAQTYVVVVADAQAEPVQITGARLPFMQQKTKLQVSPTGLVRVRELAPLQGDMSMVATYNGKQAQGFGSLTDGMVFDFNDSPVVVDYPALIKERLAK